MTPHAAMEMIQNSSAGWRDRPGKCMPSIYRKRQWNGQKKDLRGPGMGNARMYCAGHEHMEEYVQEEADVIMFNFGYLPGGDHAVATHPDTSLQAVRQGMALLKKGGVMSLCIYSGGDTGYEERDVLLEYLKDLEPARWLVIACSYYNRKNDPPQPVFVIRL